MPLADSVARRHRRVVARNARPFDRADEVLSGRERFEAAFAGTLNPETRLSESALTLQGSFRAFLREALPLVVPGGHVNWGFHLDAMADHLEAISRKQIKNLILVAPPRCLKSSTLVCWSAWEWTWDQTIRSLCTSYDRELSMRDNGAVRDLVGTDWYTERWGHVVKVRPDIDAKSLFQLTAGGRRLVSSIGSRNTGEGGERVSVDDPHNVLKAESESDRERAISWWLGTMGSRVNTADSAKIVTGQRVHHRDLIGTLIAMMIEADGEFYERLILPMEYDPRLIVGGAELMARRRMVEEDLPPPALEVKGGYYQKDLASVLKLDEDLDGFEGATVMPLDPGDRPSPLIPYQTTIGFVDPRRQPGQLLCPNQWPKAQVETFKVVLGPYRYASQYQATPTPASGGQFKDQYWQRYDFQQLWHRGLRANIIAVDSAYGQEGGDPTGVSVWGELGGRLYVLEAVEFDLETPQLRQALRDLYQKWGAPFLIEDKANGKALIADLRHGSDGGLLPSLPVIPADPSGMTKEARAYSVVPYIAGGLVYLPYEAPWVASWIQQHKEFPRGLHDDWVDTCSMAIHWLKTHTASVRDLYNTPLPATYGRHMRVAEAAGSRDGRWLS